MKIAAIVFCSLMAPLIALTLYTDAKDKHTQKALYKGLTSLCFVIAGIFCYMLSSKNTDSVLMLFALIFCMFGDILLAMRLGSEKQDMAAQGMGMLAFVLGHILFVAAFFMLVDRFKLLLFIPLACLPILVIIAFSAGVLNTEKPVMRIGAIVYAVVIAFTITAAANLRVYSGATPFSNMVIAGATLFAVSDCLLAFLNYNKKANRKALFPIVLIVYYIGQALLAMAIAYN